MWGFANNGLIANLSNQYSSQGISQDTETESWTIGKKGVVAGVLTFLAGLV
jgi:hypothetical protein